MEPPPFFNPCPCQKGMEAIFVILLIQLLFPQLHKLYSAHNKSYEQYKNKNTGFHLISPSMVFLRFLRATRRS